MTVNELIEELRKVAGEGRGAYRVVSCCGTDIDWVMRGSPRDDNAKRVQLKTEVSL